ncbi:CGNR zinc finger domain-containing protein [Kitasatospora sp. NPDC007106]|uniref:CGNR zinc finger domain-containing protein n=1 Tax=Kitasatospora sp. NPDC007106 TaxID=3156914 RepID=UPI003404408C
MRAHGTPLTTLAEARVTLLDLALGVPGPDRRWHGPAGTAGGRSPDPADRRPLLGEPLALDLLNTRWDAPAGTRDLLDDLDGYRIWLSSAGLAGLCPADGAALSATRHTREALQATLSPPYDQRRPGRAPADPDAVREVDRLLGRGALRYRLTADGPATTVEVDDPAWLAGWLALDDYLQLLGTAPERIRSCAGPHRLPLWFLDTSRNGMRRWCSMAECGNRAKAARHYRRLRAEQPAARGGARVAVG